MNPIELLTYKPLFDQYNSISPKNLSAFHFSSILSWSPYFDFKFEVIDGNLCVFASDRSGTFLYFPPLGGVISEGVLKQCFDRMGKSSRAHRVARIENVDESLLTHFNGYDIKKKSDEYLYRKQDLIDFKGLAYKSQRHEINSFLKKNTPCFESYNPVHAEACVELYARWAKDRAAHHTDSVYLAMLEDNRPVHELIFKYSDELGLVGRVVTIKEEVVAYSFGYSLNSQTFCVLLEVSDLSKKGISSFLFKNFCGDFAWHNHTMVNAMDDFHMPQVAFTKQAYHPTALIGSYTVYLKP